MILNCQSIIQYIMQTNAVISIVLSEQVYVYLCCGCIKGTANDPGINQRALTQLFAEAAERDHVSSYTIHVSVLEIYNELIHDLLSATPGTRLDVKMHAEGGVHVPGLTSVHVQSVADVNEVS